jgi:hypothetical protein
MSGLNLYRAFTESNNGSGLPHEMTAFIINGLTHLYARTKRAKA